MGSRLTYRGKNLHEAWTWHSIARTDSILFGVSEGHTRTGSADGAGKKQIRQNILASSRPSGIDGPSVSSRSTQRR